MKVTVVGSGDAFGSDGRSHTCFRLDVLNRCVLVDFGASAIVAWQRLKLDLDDIDAVVLTHLHGDHFGGMAELAKQIPIKEFIDHGPNVQPAEAPDAFLKDVYPGLYAKAKHTVAKPSDRIQVAGLDWRIVSSAGQMLKTALPGAGRPNPYCAAYKPQDPDPTENAQSVGSVVTFGKFRVAHLGDVTWNKEFDLMCPMNRVGTPEDIANVVVMLASPAASFITGQIIICDGGGYLH